MMSGFMFWKRLQRFDVAVAAGDCVLFVLSPNVRREALGNSPNWKVYYPNGQYCLHPVDHCDDSYVQGQQTAMNLCSFPIRVAPVEIWTLA